MCTIYRHLCIYEPVHKVRECVCTNLHFYDPVWVRNKYSYARSMIKPLGTESEKHISYTQKNPDRYFLSYIAQPVAVCQGQKPQIQFTSDSTARMRCPESLSLRREIRERSSWYWLTCLHRLWGLSRRVGDCQLGIFTESLVHQLFTSVHQWFTSSFNLFSCVGKASGMCHCPTTCYQASMLHARRFADLSSMS